MVALRIVGDKLMSPDRPCCPIRVGGSGLRWHPDLYDIKQAADLLGDFTAGKKFSDNKENSMLAPPWSESLKSSARRFRSFPGLIRR